MKLVYTVTFCLFCLGLMAQNTRYVNRIFPQVTKTSNITYGVAEAVTQPYLAEWATYNQTLTLDFFEPTGDTLSKRPLIVFIHSGAFLNGSKDHDDMQALCDTMARRGYVTATINYRKNFNILSSNSAERAVYRGLQDAAAAIRFFKEHRTTYRIDTNFVYAWGSSAGAFSAVNLGFLDDSERPLTTFSAFGRPDLGCVNCSGNAFAHNSKPQAVISCWGGIGDTTWIGFNNTVATIMFHGTDDSAVPIGSGHPFSYPLFPITHGSKPMQRTMSRNGIANEIHIGTNKPHEYWGTSNGSFNPSPTADYQDIINKVVAFLFPITPAVLPVSLTTFSAKEQDGDVYLHWKTETEWNNSHFEIEHSRDGKDFTAVATLTGNGNSLIPQAYQWIDKSVSSGTHYYRLRQVDFDGTATYSPSVNVYLKTASWTLYPNPSQGVFYLSTVEDLFVESWEVYNFAGEKVMIGKDIDKGIDLSALPKGNYLLRIYDEAGVSDFKMLHW